MTQKKILIVEDEESLLKLESILLTSRGYAVTGVVDGKSALESISADPPDLVLLDVMLPGIDGFEVCRRIKSDPATRHIPVVMLTAKKSAGDVSQGAEAGSDAYLTKPFKSAQVMQIIESLIAGTAGGGDP